MVKLKKNKHAQIINNKIKYNRRQDAPKSTVSLQYVLFLNQILF